MDEVEKWLPSHLVVVVCDFGSHNFPCLAGSKRSSYDKVPHVTMRNWHQVPRLDELSAYIKVDKFPEKLEVGVRWV
jgi:hypothetical protein